MAYCKNCGTKLDEGAKFCSKCGTPSGSETKQDTETKQKKSSKKGGLIAIIIVLAVLALGGAAWYFLGNQQDKYSLEGLAKAAVNYDAVGDFHDGLAQVSKGEKIGFIDKMGNEVIPCIYDFMEETDCSFHEGLAFVRQGDNCYFINKEGKKAFDFKYDAANHFSEGLAIVWKDGKCGYIDKKGNEVIALTDKYFGNDFSEGLAAVMSKDGKLGFIDMKGNVVIPFNYDITEGDTPLFSEGYAAIQKGGKYGFIDKNGKEVIPLKYDNAYPFSEGLAVVMLDDKFGFVDVNGNMVIPCEYGSAASFSEGYAAVSKDEKFFFIDKNGKQAFPTSYDCWLGSFHDGIASVNKFEEGNIMVGYIDAKGNEIAPCIYSGNDFSEGLAVIQKDGIFGFVDKKGNSTFDLQNEAVKSVIQSKIQEKEEKRKQEEEEQRKAEEERKRIEEENKPQNVFYRLAKSGDYVWNYDFHKDVGYGGREHSCIFFFYPESPTTGRLSYNELHWNDDPSSCFYGVHTAFYTVTDENIIRATLVRNQGDPRYFKENQTILLRMEKNGDEIVLKEISGYQDMTLRQKGKDRKDHAR